jgi:serine/threonine protein kinase
MELKPGAKLGPCEILSRIGEGGMGQVWKARDTRPDRFVAIKTSHKKFSERFEREALARSKILAFDFQLKISCSPFFHHFDPGGAPNLFGTGSPSPVTVTSR